MADDNIKSIQEALFLCACYPGSVDGVMGPNTEKAIREFQTRAEIGVDGLIGPQTKAALATQLSKAATRASTLQGYFQGGSVSAADAL